MGILVMTSIKDINHSRILNLIRLNPDISRIEISNQTGLGKATVSSIVTELLDDHVVFEDGANQDTANAGRRPVKLRLNNQKRLAMGIELTGSEIIGILADLYSQPLRIVRHVPQSSKVEASLEVIEQIYDELLAGYDKDLLLGIGVGVPGSVSLDQQRVIQAVNIGWFDIPLGKLIHEKLGTPVVVVKRQHAGAFGEYRHGIGKGKPTLLYVSIGVGIGSGIVLNGEPYQGINGGAGEIGHITIVPDGQRCNCGNFGCLETVASCPAIATRARERIKQGGTSILSQYTEGLLESITAKMVFTAADAGDSLAREVISEAAGYIGIAIANVVNLFNPALVIVGGEVLENSNLFLEPILAEVRRRALSMPLSVVEVVPSSLGYLAASIGASTLIIDRFFALPDPFYEKVLRD
jgi:glucokinase-like ROK family protein